MEEEEAGKRLDASVHTLREEKYLKRLVHTHHRGGACMALWPESF